MTFAFTAAGHLEDVQAQLAEHRRSVAQYSGSNNEAVPVFDLLDRLVAQATWPGGLKIEASGYASAANMVLKLDMVPLAIPPKAAAVRSIDDVFNELTGKLREFADPAFHLFADQLESVLHGFAGDAAAAAPVEPAPAEAEQTPTPPPASEVSAPAAAADAPGDAAEASAA